MWIDADLYSLCFFIVICFTLSGWLVTLGIKINYGRLKNSISKIEIPASISWFIFEIPNLIWAFYFLIIIEDPLSLGYSLFIIHYINRSIIYPLTLKTKTKMPLEIIISALFFTTSNGYLQGVSNHYIQYQIPSSLSYFIKMLGVAVFAMGMYINIKSDSILQAVKLRAISYNEKQKYVLINEFLFEYVSNPNYLGEIIQWFGYFMVCQTVESFLFFFSTLNILTAAAIPRNRWNRENIPGYSRERKAVIPFVI